MAHETDADPAISLLATAPQGSVLLQHAINCEQVMAYGAYGYDPARKGVPPVLGYNAQPRDLTGNYLLGNGYRAYNPVLMVFISPDIYSPFDKGGLNCYAYCNRDPINLIDPEGAAGSRPPVFTVNAMPELDSLPFMPRQRIAQVPRQDQAPAIVPVNAPVHEVPIQPQQPAAAHPAQRQASALRRVPNNLETLVAARGNIIPQPRRHGVFSHIGSILRRISRYISSRLHPRRPDVAAPVREANYSAQRMHAIGRAYRQALTNNPNAPLARTAHNVRREN